MTHTHNKKDVVFSKEYLIFVDDDARIVLDQYLSFIFIVLAHWNNTRHDIAEILLKVALNTNQSINWNNSSRENISLQLAPNIKK
jgi:hypothetical protein